MLYIFSFFMLLFLFYLNLIWFHFAPSLPLLSFEAATTPFLLESRCSATFLLPHPSPSSSRRRVEPLHPTTAQLRVPVCGLQLSSLSSNPSKVFSSSTKYLVFDKPIIQYSSVSRGNAIEACQQYIYYTCFNSQTCKIN